jgi:hypothetical protein
MTNEIERLSMSIQKEKSKNDQLEEKIVLLTNEIERLNNLRKSM